MGNSIEPITTSNKTVIDKTHDCFVSLLNKISAGDIATNCAQMFAVDQLAENKSQIAGIKVQSRQVQEARKLRLELLKKQFEASQKSGFWDKVSKIVSGIFAAIAAIVYIIPGAGLLASAIVGAVGAAIAGGFSLASAYYNRQATDTATQMIKNNLQKQTAETRRDDAIAVIQNLAQMEKSMMDRIRSIQESEHRTGGTDMLKPAAAK